MLRAAARRLDKRWRMEQLQRDGNAIVHGDSTTDAAYASVLGGDRCQLVHADPPYCLLTRRNKRGQRRDPKRAKINHEAVTRYENIRAYRRFTRAWMELACGHLDESGHAIVWTNFLGRGPIQQVAAELGLCFHGEYQWAKLTRKGQGNEIMARLYEVALIFGRHPAAALRPSDRCPPRHMVSGYDVEGEAGDWDNHPNHKPFTVLEPLLRHYTAPGERVLEPFSGSGSTAAACVLLGRRVSAIELRAHWASVSQERLVDALGRL